MALLSQLVAANVLSKLSDTHISILNAHLEAELLHNAAVKNALTGKAAEVLKSMGHH